jgi:DNA-binding MarR family transcriptional regulator
MGEIELVREIIELQRQVSRALGQYTPDTWMELNVTIAQLKSLVFIAKEGATNLRKLAAALGVTPSNVTGIIDRLVEQGLVSRQENSEDRRMLVLQATDKGKALLDNLRERRISHLSEVLARMNQEDLSSLARGLSSLAKAAEAYKESTENEHG